ncbi:MAG TPA: DUF3830 family protein [Gemmatimonadaceae bacterium]
MRIRDTRFHLLSDRALNRPALLEHRAVAEFDGQAFCVHGVVEHVPVAGVREACWIPLGDYQLGVGYENHTSHPSRGDVLWYPGGISETELLFAYGSSLFASKVGQLAGNHFLEIVEGGERLEEMGRYVLYHGVQDIVFEEV